MPAMRYTFLVVLAAGPAAWNGVARAWAQPTAAPVGAQVPMPPPPPPPPDLTGDALAPLPAVEARDDAAWRLYHQAFAALAKGDRPAARAALAQLDASFPGHPATLAAHRGLGIATAAGHTPGGREQPDQAARAELALFQTLHGAAVGVELCVALECDKGEGYIGLALLGGAGGAALALRSHPTSGQRALVNSGAVWGAFNAAMALVATQPDRERSFGLTLLAGQGAGVGLALLLSTDAPTAGQVALTNSGGQWTLALTGLGLVAADVNLDDRQVGTTLAIAADAGLGAGAYLASQLPRVSRAQTLVIDAAGIVGAVAGGAGGVMATGNVDDRTTAGLAAVGAAIGLGAAAYFTRDWGEDDDGPPITATIMPVRGGGGLVSAHLVW